MLALNWRLDASQLNHQCDEALTLARQKLAARLDARSDDPLAALRGIEDLRADLEDSLGLPALLAEVYIDNDDASRVAALRDASRGCQARAQTFGLTLDADPRLWRLAKAAQEQARDPIDRQLASTYRQAGERAGAQLADKPRARLAREMARLQKLEEGFQQALGADRSMISLSAAQVATLPPALRDQAKARKSAFELPVAMQTYEPFMRNVPSSALRERFMRIYFERGGKANSARVDEAARTRDTIARLLGSDNWARHQLASYMAGAPERAQALIDRLAQALRPRAEAELARLAAMKRADGDATPFGAWDYAYYEQRHEQEHFAVDAQAIARYFPSEPMIAATMKWYEHIFGVRFERRDDIELWDPLARIYLLRDAKDDRPLSWCILDIAPRAEKVLRPASGALRGGRELADGTYQLPIAIIVGSGPAAAAGQPALFSHRDAVEFFHEFGHLMHSALSHTRYASLHGVRVRRDFVETPSQMFENWMWEPKALRAISHHVDTGEPLSETQIQAMVAARHAADGVFWTRQAFMAAFDLALHARKEPIAPDALWYQLAPRYTPLPLVDHAHPVASFLPVMGGYDAGYYGYLWSRVFAADLFTVFTREGLDSPAVGKRFRDQVLGPGAQAEPDVLLRAFLGREPSADAWLGELGIATASPAPPAHKQVHSQ